MYAIQLLRALALSLLLIGANAAIADDATAVNINTADAETLATLLEGVGLSRAQAIVAHRQANGRFVAADDLANVKGIGPSIVERNRERIRVE